MYPFSTIDYVSVHFIISSLNGNIFRFAGSLRGEFIVHRWIPIEKPSDANLWCFLWSAPAQTVQQTIVTPVIWDTIVLIMTSLLCLVTLFFFGYKIHSLFMTGRLHTAKFVSLYIQQWVLRTECHHQNWMSPPVSKSCDTRSNTHAGGPYASGAHTP